MATNFRDLVDAFPPERRARIDARKASLISLMSTPSCGCIFCDLDLPPEKMKRQWIHHIPSQGRIVVCEVKNLKPRS